MVLWDIKLGFNSENETWSYPSGLNWIIKSGLKRKIISEVEQVSLMNFVQQDKRVSSQASKAWLKETNHLKNYF